MKILANWDYSRRDLMYAFNKLSTHFDFTFLFFDVPEKDFTQTDFKIIYWNDHKSPYEILEKVNPDKIIFHDIESFHQVALNIAAHNKNIQTIVLEHGLRRESEVKSAYDQILKEPLSRVHMPTFRFFLKSLSLKNLKDIFGIIAFVYFRKRYGLTVGLNKAKFLFRQADLYLNFTKRNASYIMERDGIPLSKVRLFGDPSFDEILGELNSQSPLPDQKDYFLLVDSPFVESNVFRMKEEEKINFYKKINAFCLSQKKKLVIKLHPHSSIPSMDEANITFVKDGNIAKLIREALGCIFIHQSGLLPLAMLYNKAILFNTYPEYNKDITENEYTTVLSFHDFKPSNIHFKELTAEQKKKVVQDYLFSTDGKATERLEEILSDVE